MKSFKFFLFVLLFSFASFCRADVRLTTSSGQEVYLTDSQFYYIRSMYGLLQDYWDFYDETSNFQADFLNVLIRLSATDSYMITNAINNNVYNLSYYSNTYSNLLSRFLIAYTNDLQVKFASLPTYSQTAQMRSYLQEIWEMTFKNYNTFASWNGTGNLTHSSYLQTNSIERAMRQDAKTIFDDWYIKNISSEPEYTTHVFDTTYDIFHLKNIIERERENISYMYSMGYATSNPLILSNALIRVNAIQKLYYDKCKAYNDNYQASLRMASDLQSIYVDRFTGNISEISEDSDLYQALSAIHNFNASSMPINDALDFATNMLSKLNNPYDSEFGSMAQEQKDKLSDMIQKQVSMACDWKEQKQLDDFVNGLQQMLNTMSNCCSNMSALPVIADMVSNIVENIGQYQPGTGGGGGGDTNNVASGEYPLGFPPSETNTVAYYRDWQDYNPSSQISQLQIVDDVKYDLERHNTEEHNQKSEQVVSNVTGRIIPIVDKFRSYSQNFSRQSPPQRVHVLDCTPIQTFATDNANLDAGLGSNSGFLDTAWLYTKLLSPLHGFFTLFWLLLSAFLVIASWLFFIRKFYRFRLYLTKLWKTIKDLFK